LTWIYPIDDEWEHSLLGEANAVKLGNVTLNPEGSKKAVYNEEAV